MATHVSPRYTIDDIRGSDPLRFVNVYEDQVRKWILAPATILRHTNAVNNGYAILSILLTFFEPHGRFTSTHAELRALRDQIGRSGAFKAGLSRFRRFCGILDRIGEHDVDEVVYVDLRNGVFHQPITKPRVAIQCQALMSDLPFGEHHGRVLVDPWRLLEAMQAYTFDFFSRARTEEALCEAINAYSRIVYKRALHGS